MFKKTLSMVLLLSCLCLEVNFAWAADPLLLTPEEMQKLKKYFPSNDTADAQRFASDTQAVSPVNKNPDALVSGSTAKSEETSTSNEAQTDSAANMNEADTYVALTRYAWQQLYAPTRFLSNPLGIHRVEMKTNTLQSNLIYGDKVIVHPLASWSLNNTYITAITLRNQYPHPTNIQIPQDICGDWTAAVIYPRDRLSAMGNKLSDSTTLFLMSRKPFNEASEVCHVSA